MRRAHGDVTEAQAETLPVEKLGQEWEWEETPEVTLVIVTGMAEAVKLFNDYSPQFVASLITENADHFTHFYETVNAPFVGNGFTRWVDGQYALSRPELGLSNWQTGPPVRARCRPQRRRHLHRPHPRHPVRPGRASVTP